MLIVNIVLAVLLSWIVPYLAGNGFCEVLKIKKTVPKLYVMGLIAIWAFCQFITVPLVLLKASFLTVVILLSAWILILCGYGIYRNHFPSFIKGRGKSREQKIVVLITGILITFFLVAAFFGQHMDADDSRFVVNAVDIVRTNKMFLTDPNTGSEITTWLGELGKDVTAPWAVYLAYCGKVMGLSPAVIAHTILPAALLGAVLGVWWMLSEEFFGAELVHQCVFVDVLMFLYVYGYFSLYSSETFTMVRIWQGKAVIAGLGVPAMFLICIWIYRYGQKSAYACMLFLNLALCLMSGMGVIIGALLLGVFGFLYGIFKKNWRITMCLWGMVIPNVIYYGIYSIIKQGL